MNFLLLQDGSYFLLQDGFKLIIGPDLTRSGNHTADSAEIFALKDNGDKRGIRDQEDE